MRRAIILLACMAIPMVCSQVMVACGDETTTRTSTSGSVSTSAEKSSAVNISGNRFDPAELVVGVGTTVTWSNDDSTRHTITASSGTFDSGDLKSGQDFSYTFDESGTFEYGCTIHPFMKGTVTVK